MKQLSKREGIEFLLEHWVDIFDPSGTTAAPRGAPDDGSGVALMPKMSRERSPIELATCLAGLRRYAPNHAAILMRHYTAEWRITYERRPAKNAHGKTIRDKDGKPTMKTIPVRQRVLPYTNNEQRIVHERMVERAVDFLCATFRGDVYVPDALMEAAA